MKITKKELLKIMYETEGEDVDLFDIIPKNSKLLQFDSKGDLDVGIMKRADGSLGVIEKSEEIDSQISQIKLVTPSFGMSVQTVPDLTCKDYKELIDENESVELRDSNYKLKSSSVFSEDSPVVKDDAVENFNLDDIHPYYKDAYNAGYIRDIHYLSVLSKNQTYLQYLESKPKLFLVKRLQWKINKIIGYRGIGKGYYKDYYKMSFLDFCFSEKGKEFINLSLDGLYISNPINPVVDVIVSMYNFGCTVDEIIYAILRPKIIDIGFNRTRLSLAVLSVKVSSSLECNLMELLSKNSSCNDVVEKVYDRLIKLGTSESSVVSLLQPNYMDVVERKKEYNKFIKIGKLIRSLDSSYRHGYSNLISDPKNLIKFRELYEIVKFPGPSVFTIESSYVALIESARCELDRLSSIFYSHYR